MTLKKIPFIPLLNTAAGNTLTLANWQELGIDRGAYSLTELLIKPGLAFLKSLANLRRYSPWPGPFVLNASLREASLGQASYKLRSPHDGQLIEITLPELFELIQCLQPEAVLLPLGATATQLDWLTGLPTTACYFPGEEILSLAGGEQQYYLVYDNNLPFNDFLQTIKGSEARIGYVIGEFSLEQFIELSAFNLSIISDAPAKEALSGQIVHPEGRFTLTNKTMANQHQVLDENCICPSCKQKFTRAYLHHLFSHVPILCQRFLIQHNIGEIIRTSFT